MCVSNQDTRSQTAISSCWTGVSCKDRNYNNRGKKQNKKSKPCETHCTFFLIIGEPSGICKYYVCRLVLSDWLDLFFDDSRCKFRRLKWFNMRMFLILLCSLDLKGVDSNWVRAYEYICWRRWR